MLLLSIEASESIVKSYRHKNTCSILHSSIKEVLYERQPRILDPSIVTPVVKLNKCMCGLKQAAFE